LRISQFTIGLLHNLDDMAEGIGYRIYLTKDVVMYGTVTQDVGRLPSKVTPHTESTHRQRAYQAQRGFTFCIAF
jgi:hypothetical protein